MSIRERKLIYCPQCKMYRYEHDFNRNRLTHADNWICNYCYNFNMSEQAKVERILQDVKLVIPTKPVYKYIDESIISNSKN